MDLAFLPPLYEHPGSWASVYVETSRHTEDTPHERHLTSVTLTRGGPGLLKIPGEQQSRPARADDALIRSAVTTGAPALSVAPVAEATGGQLPAGGPGALLRWS